MSKKEEKKGKDIDEEEKGKKGKKDHKKGKKEDKDDKSKKNPKKGTVTSDQRATTQGNSSDEDDMDELMQTGKHKKGKPEKGQGLTIILETKIHNFDVKVEVNGINCYYDVFHKLIYIHDSYRLTNKSLDSEYKIEYFNHTWQEFFAADYEKLQDRQRMRVTNRIYNVPIQLPVIPRPKQQYLGINLKALQELPTGITGGKLSPYVALWITSQHKYRTLIKQHVNEYTFNENFVIPVAHSYIQKGKIACFLELAVFNYSSHGTDTRIGKAKLPLAVLERGHAKPRGVIIKLDKGGLVDMEIRWFENDQLIIAPEDTKGYRRGIGIGGVFFTPPSIVKEKKNLKKPRADELEWFLNLPQIPLKDLLPGDIVLVKFYDILYEEDKACNEVFYEIVDRQKEIVATKGTCFSVAAFLVTKEGGENIGIQVTGGISLDSKFPNYNCLVYRSKNPEQAKEAAAWTTEILQKYPNLKYSPAYEDGFSTDITPVVEGQNAMSEKELPAEMMDSELVVAAYQATKGAPMIDINAKHACPILLENHLNTHLENDFSFVGIVVQHIDDQEIAKRGPPRSEKAMRKIRKQATVNANVDSPKKGMKKAKSEKVSKKKGEGEKDEPDVQSVPLALQGPTGVHKCPIFGLSLVEAYGDGPDLPYFWQSIFGFLNQPEFCSTVGIFRVPGSADEANWYKRLFDEGRDVTFDCTCHDAVGLLKMYIRELPENVIPTTFDQQVPYIMSQYKENAPELLKEIKFIIDQMPKAHYVFVKSLMHLLYNILQQAEINKMHSDNIIRCIVPTMKCGPQIIALAFNNYHYMFEGASLDSGDATPSNLNQSTDVIAVEGERATTGDNGANASTPNGEARENTSFESPSSPHPTGGMRVPLQGQAARGNRGVATRVANQAPKEPAVRARPAWMGQANPAPTANNTNSKVEPSERKTITINVDNNTEGPDAQITPRGKDGVSVVSESEKQRRKKNRRSEVFFYNPTITKSDTTASDQTQLESAFQLAEANESEEESSETEEFSEDTLSTDSSSSEMIITK